jgi:hypothetical protein
MRLVASGECAVRRHGEYTRSGEGNRPTGSIGTSSLHVVFKIRFESSEYSRHTPSSGLQGEFKPVGVVRSVCLMLRCALHPDNEALQECPRNVQDIHGIQNYPDNVAPVDTCDVPLSSLLNKAYPDQLARIYEAGHLQAFSRSRRIQTVWRASTELRANEHFVNAHTIYMCWRQSVARVALIMLLAARGIQTFWRCHSFRKPYH